MRNILLAIFLLWSTPLWATTYYLNTSCTHNGNGTLPGCAVGAGLAGAFNTCTSITSLGTSNDVAILTDTTLACGWTQNWGGTSGDHVTITSYGSGAKPIFDGRSTASSWTLYSGNIYYATVTPDDVNMVSSDDVGLQEIAWNTNIATTAASMTASTWTLNNSGNLLYVWLADGSDPTGHTIKYGTVESYIMSSGTVGYIDISNIVVKGAKEANIHFGYEGNRHPYVTVTNVDSTLSGARGISLDGPGSKVDTSTCSYASLRAGVDNACIVVDWSSSGSEISFNQVTDTLGSCYESNRDNDSTLIYGNSGTNCGHAGIELYGDGTGTTTGVTNNLVYGNILDNTARTTGVYGDLYSQCIGVGNNASLNKVYNNICDGFQYGGVGTRAGTTRAKDGKQNEFYNNTIIADDALNGSIGGALVVGGADDAAHVGLNIFKNNIVILTGGGKGVQTLSAKDTFNNNIYYGVTSWKYNGTTYGTLATYQSASSQDLSSSTSNPQLTGYIPGSGSPAIDAGATLADVTDDYIGTARPQGSAYDIGAYEMDYSSGGAGGGVTGGIVSGGRFN